MEMKMVSVLGLLALVIASASTNNAGVGVADAATTIRCAEAITSLMPCAVFLSGPADKPSVACCLAVSGLDNIANLPETRKYVCECFKQAAPTFQVKVDKAMQLPQLCGIQVPVPVDPKVNCSSSIHSADG